MVNTTRVNAGHGRDFHPLASHMTELKISPKAKFVNVRFHFYVN